MKLKTKEIKDKFNLGDIVKIKNDDTILSIFRYSMIDIEHAKRYGYLDIDTNKYYSSIPHEVIHLGIRIENHFDCMYVTLEGKIEIIKEIHQDLLETATKEEKKEYIKNKNKVIKSKFGITPLNATIIGIVGGIASTTFPHIIKLISKLEIFKQILNS